MQTRMTTLTGRNFFTFKKIEINLSNQGLVWIRGRNGVGKSAMFELMRHILLGSTARGLKGPGIVRAGSRVGYVGTLAMEKDGQTYTLLQSQKHKKHGSSLLVYKGLEMTEDSLISHQRAKTRTQQEVTDKYLGMTKQQFDAAVFISQRDQHPMVNGTGAQCAAYLSQTFGLDVYDEMREKLKGQIDSTATQLGEADALTRILAQARTRISELGSREELLLAITKVKDEISSLKTETLKLNGQIGLAEQTMSQAEERAKLIEELGDHAGSVLVDLCDERDALDNSLQAVNDQLAAAKQATIQAEFRAEIEAQIASFTEKIDVIPLPAQLQEEINLSQKALAKFEKLIEKHVGPASMLAKLQKLDADAAVVCPCCGQTVDSDHLKNEIDAAKHADEMLTSAREGLAKAKAISMQRTQLLATQERRIGEQGRLKKQLLALPAPIVIDGQHDKLIAKKNRLVGLIAELNSSIPQLRRLHDLPEVDAAAGKKAKELLVASHARKYSITDLVSEANRKLGGLQGKVEEIERLDEQIVDSESRLVDIHAIKRENDLRKTLVRAIARLKVRRLHGIVQAIEKALPPYVGIMFGQEDMVIEVDDKDPESIERWCSRPSADDPSTRVRFPLLGMSVGESAKLSIAFIWAIRKLMRPERTVNFLVLDEADRGLDPQGLEAYGSLLEQLKQEYESIFLISHRKELSTVRFDKVWTVEKNGGVSRLIEES